MQHSNENTTDYPVRFRNEQRANEACNESLIKRGVQEYGMKIFYPLHATGFDTQQENDKKEVDT